MAARTARQETWIGFGRSVQHVLSESWLYGLAGLANETCAWPWCASTIGQKVSNAGTRLDASRREELLPGLESEKICEVTLSTGGMLLSRLSAILAIIEFAGAAPQGGLKSDGLGIVRAHCPIDFS